MAQQPHELLLCLTLYMGLCLALALQLEVKDQAIWLTLTWATASYVRGHALHWSNHVASIGGGHSYLHRMALRRHMHKPVLQGLAMKAEILIGTSLCRPQVWQICGLVGGI